MMKRYTMFITEESLAALQGIAERTGSPVAWQIREAVDAYLKAKNHYPMPMDSRQMELDLG